MTGTGADPSTAGQSADLVDQERLGGVVDIPAADYRDSTAALGLAGGIDQVAS